MKFDFGQDWHNPIQFTFSPIAQPDDSNLILTRQKCEKHKDVFTLFPNNKLIEKSPKGVRNGVCYHTAIKESLGLSQKQFNQIEKSILGLQDWVTIIGMPHNFFDQKEFPEKGDLALYMFKKEKFVHHLGIVTNTGRIKSKIGASKYTIEHDYWDLPYWGDTLCFWKLKSMYQNQKGKDLLFSKIMDIIKQSPRIQTLRDDAQKTLFALAAKKDANTMFYNSVYKEPALLLRGLVSLDIDLPNSEQETALMIAAKNDNLELVALLIEYGANRNLKNKDNKTAVDLAEQNNHQQIINYLNPYPKKVMTYYALTTLLITMLYFYNVII